MRSGAGKANAAGSARRVAIVRHKPQRNVGYNVGAIFYVACQRFDKVRFYDRNWMPREDSNLDRRNQNP